MFLGKTNTAILLVALFNFLFGFPSHPISNGNRGNKIWWQKLSFSSQKFVFWNANGKWYQQIHWFSCQFSAWNCHVGGIQPNCPTDCGWQLDGGLGICCWDNNPKTRWNRFCRFDFLICLVADHLCARPRCHLCAKRVMFLNNNMFTVSMC